MTNTIVAQISGNTTRVNEATQHLIELAAEPGCGLARDSALVGPVLACDATTFCATDPIGETFVRVGEACFSLDPLSFTGVEKAMQTGLIAATAAHRDRLAGPQGLMSPMLS